MMGKRKVKGRDTGRQANALRSARRLLVDERSAQFQDFVVPGTLDTPAAYQQMLVSERDAIRRFDRVIAKIDEALR